MLKLGKFMFNINVIESGVKNNVHQLTVNNQDLYSVLKTLYGTGFCDLFDVNGVSKGFVRVFLNSIIVDSLKGVLLNEGDEVQVVSAFSGG